MDENPKPGVIAYATPMPGATQIQCSFDGDAVIVTAQLKRKWDLWREALMPIVAISFMVGFLAMVVVGQAFAIEEIFVLVGLPGIWGKAITAMGLIFAIGYFSWDAWQNGGVVTRIEVREGWLIWTKTNLWGTRAVRWRADTITRVFMSNVVGMRQLKIKRSNGLGMQAFTFRPAEEITWAAMILRQAVGLPGKD